MFKVSQIFSVLTLLIPLPTVMTSTPVFVMIDLEKVIF